MGAAAEQRRTLHPTVQAITGGIKARILLDSGAGSSYISTSFITKLNLKPIRREKKCIEQLYGTIKKDVEIYKIKLSSLIFNDFEMDIECTNAEKEVLTYLPNPQIDKIKKKYYRLRRLQFTESNDGQDMQPVHIILGAAEYQRIKTTEPAVLGDKPDTDPGAELTMLGWTLTGSTIMSENGTKKGLLSCSGKDEFEQLCSLDVLGLQDSDVKQNVFHQEFMDNLKRLGNGCYETRLPWKKDVPKLPTNKELSLCRLRSTSRRLEKINALEEYNQIMEEQIKEGILEPVPETPTGPVVHYIPHQAVIQENAESTKLRIVYDCSAQANSKVPSLNDCLEIGPSLQPLIFDILVRNRMKKYCIIADIKKAFLQIRIDDRDRDAQRLLWYKSLKDKIVMELRFTRLIFGSGPSPYVLNAVMEKHLKNYESTYPITTKALQDDTYVDDVQYGDNSEAGLKKFKHEASTILQDAGFELHKWHSNIRMLEDNNNEMSETYAKQTTKTRSEETKILGIPWNKNDDTISVDFSSCIEKGKEEILTKRKVISALNSVFDVLGISSPVMITGKLLYSEICLKKLRWDEKLPPDIEKKWKKWIQTVGRISSLTIPRCVIENNTEIKLHGFSDASKSAICAVIYIVSAASSRKGGKLVAAKSKVASKNLSIPRLELVAAHMLCKLVKSVMKALYSFKINQVYCWVDSTTVLYWIKRKGTWSTFVRNRSVDIGKYENIKWQYVPTKENPSDIGSRGIINQETLPTNWFYGLEWILDENK